MKKPLQDLARRERQMRDILYTVGRANAAEVLEHLPDIVSYSTVRKVLSILEEKGHVRHVEQNRRYVYVPIQSRKDARLSALRHLMDTLFESSAESVVSTLLDISDTEMSNDDLQRLEELIEQHRKERE